jgi:hypothetical protein
MTRFIKIKNKIYNLTEIESVEISENLDEPNLITTKCIVFKTRDGIYHKYPGESSWYIQGDFENFLSDTDRHYTDCNASYQEGKKLCKEFKDMEKSFNQLKVKHE